MKNPFKREANSYKYDAPATPFQRAQQEWDLRMGDARVQAKNWRTAAISALMALAVIVIILLAVILGKKERVYIAEVTKEGRVVNVAPLMVKYQPTDAQKRYFLVHFLELTRGLQLDPVLAKKNWLEAYNFVDNHGAVRLNQYFREHNPIAKLGKETVSLQINDVNPLTDYTTHIDWSETTVNTDGEVISRKDFSGVFTIAIKQPLRQQDILHNPLGIYLIDFNITEKEAK